MPVGVVLINLIVVRRPILTVGSAFPFPEWEILHCVRVKKASWTLASLFLSSGSRHCVIIHLQLPCLNLWHDEQDSWTVSQANPFCPKLFLSRILLQPQHEKPSQPAHSLVLKMLAPLFCFVALCAHLPDINTRQVSVTYKASLKVI